ncbi:MAG: HEAT repeat domain-containing protein [Acidobacteriota bacterium]
MRRPKSNSMKFLLIGILVATASVAWPRFPQLEYETADTGQARSQGYRDAQQALDRGDWSEAASLFAEIAEKGDAESDDALYWQAWAQNKLGRSTQALKTVGLLESRYPSSPWLDEARALQAEIDARAAEEWSGDETDEELKLYALNSLLMAEPERALPILDKYVRGDYSPRLKERALFVLSQSEAPAARTLLEEIAAGDTDPNLALAAIQYLGMDQSAQAASRLESIYRSTEDRRVKSRILESLAMGQHKDLVLAVAREEADLQLRAKAIELLGMLDAIPELEQLYAAETEVQLKAHILEALMLAGDTPTLIDVATTESDPALKAKAIEALAMSASAEASQALASLYASSSDPAIKAKIIESFMLQDDAEALIQVIETEQDQNLRRHALEVLSMMDSEAASTYMLEVLER